MPSTPVWVMHLLDAFARWIEPFTLLFALVVLVSWYGVFAVPRLWPEPPELLEERGWVTPMLRVTLLILAAFQFVGFVLLMVGFFGGLPSSMAVLEFLTLRWPLAEMPIAVLYFLLNRDLKMSACIACVFFSQFAFLLGVFYSVVANV